MSDKLEELSQYIKNLSKMEYYDIEITDESPELFDSKIGGIPYWPSELVYPTNSEGKKLFLLAQINFEKEKVESPLPTKGLLQFFIGDDIIMGVNYDDLTDQKNFRVIYHENIDYKINKESIKKLDIPDTKNAEFFPVMKESKISLNKGIDYANIGDFRFDNFFKLAYKKVYNIDLQKTEFCYKILSIEDKEKLEIKMENQKLFHKMLGYSRFTQEDPRYNKKYADYDTLLLQINSNGKNVVWGDVGIGNFFISKQSLLKKDFSKVLYNWDCA